MLPNGTRCPIQKMSYNRADFTFSQLLTFPSNYRFLRARKQLKLYNLLTILQVFLAHSRVVSNAKRFLRSVETQFSAVDNFKASHDGLFLLMHDEVTGIFLIMLVNH